jgi:hypothetical protein
MEFPFLTVNNNTSTNDEYTTLNQQYVYEQAVLPQYRERN